MLLHVSSFASAANDVKAEFVASCLDRRPAFDEARARVRQTSRSTKRQGSIRFDRLSGEVGSADAAGADRPDRPCLRLPGRAARRDLHRPDRRRGADHRQFDRAAAGGRRRRGAQPAEAQPTEPLAELGVAPGNADANATTSPNPPAAARGGRAMSSNPPTYPQAKTSRTRTGSNREQNMKIGCRFSL